MSSNSDRFRHAAARGASVLLCLLATEALATQPPRQGVAWPSEQIVERIWGFAYNRAYIAQTERLRANRAALARGDINMAQAAAAGGVAISGARAIPVLMGTFSNTASPPYPVGNLQTELFDGPWSSGTMTEYYQEISYGQLNVGGTVFPWIQTANPDSFYEGGCNGLCNAARTADFLTEILDLNDGAVDFSQFDNDGPDGLPNSGDDDGFVDFVAFVHPEAGGECGTGNLWSHRFALSGWTGNVYVTNDAAAGGGNIRIDDYVIMPALACDGATMIEIGVFAHEFGHAFGLPDLYDTDANNGASAGIGNWGLMASGSWGGDGASPETPSHMSAWSKEFLGWVTPMAVAADRTPATIADAETNAAALRISISATSYYLVENRQAKNFDATLPVGGLLVWKIDDSVIQAGLGNNRVNADENNQGVELVEADGRTDLDDNANRGDTGDPFPGSTGNRTFDNGSTPASLTQLALCQIGNPSDAMTADILVSTGNCAPAGGLQLALALDPDERLGKGDTTTARAFVTDGAGQPVTGVTVQFSVADTSDATVSPASASTNASGVAETTVRGEAGSMSRGTTTLTAQANSASASTPVRVPGLSWIGLAVLAFGIGTLRWFARRWR